MRHILGILLILCSTAVFAGGHGPLTEGHSHTTPTHQPQHHKPCCS